MAHSELLIHSESKRTTSLTSLRSFKCDQMDALQQVVCSLGNLPVNVDKLEDPISPKTKTVGNSEQIAIFGPAGSQRQETKGELWAKDRHDRAKVVEKHLHWIRNQEEGTRNDRSIWLPLLHEKRQRRVPAKIEEIKWGSSSIEEGSDDATSIAAIWDEDGFLRFEYARKLQEKHLRGKRNWEGAKDLTHTEVDVEGTDAKGNRVRVRKTLEVSLSVGYRNKESGKVEKTIMELTKALSLVDPHEFSLPARKTRETEPHQLILQQLAQHELNSALDERNFFLREVFGQDVDHVRKRRESTIGSHDWNFQLPEVAIRGPDGTMLHLNEMRTDTADDGEVELTHTITIVQTRTYGRNHLFDLPTGGSEAERRIRQARWSISSAIDRCVASGSAERFVVDKWVDGMFLP